MIPTKDINSYAKDSAKSFTEVINVVKFYSNYVTNAGDIESGKKLVKLSLEIFMLKQFDLFVEQKRSFIHRCWKRRRRRNT
jgi:hypothetical protein